MAESSPKGWKTLREKEKLLITSNFCFSHSVFKRLELQTHKSQGLFGKGFPKQAQVFTCRQYRSFENTMGKGEIARNEQFLLFPLCFLLVYRTFCHFNQIVICQLFTFGRVYNLLFGKGLIFMFVVMK